MCLRSNTRTRTCATPPPPLKKPQQLALGMPIDCGTEYANRCGENVEVCEWMKYPHRLPIDQSTQPNPKCHIYKKTKKVLSHCENLAVSWDRLKPSTTNKEYTNEQANTNHHYGSNTDQSRSIASLYLTHSYGWTFLNGRIVCGIRWILCACFGLPTKPFLRG